MSQTQTTVKNALSLGGGTLFSRVLGLLRDVLFAYILGSGLVADIFLAAFRIPHFFRRLLYEGGATMSFIPIFRQTDLRDGRRAAYTFGRTAIVELSFSALCLALLCVYGADAVAALIMPGYADNAEVLEQTGALIKVCVFFLPIAIVATLSLGMLVAIRRFAVPAFGPALLNVGFLAAAGYVLASRITGLEAALILCFGLLAGAVLQLIVPLIALARHGFSLIGKIDHQALPSRAFLRAMPASAFGSASYQMTVVLAMFMASFLGPGHISALYFAERLLELPMALIGVSLATASLGYFTKLSIEEQRDALSREVGNVLSVCFFFSLPAAVGMGVLAMPLVAGIFGHGEFDIGGVSLTVVAMVFYTPALPAVAGSRPLLAALNARGRTLPTVGAALLSLGVMLIAGNFLVEPYGIAGIAASASISAWFNFILLALALKKARMSGFFPWKNFGIYLCLSLVMGAMVWLGLEIVDRYYYELSVYLRLGLGLFIGVGGYLCLAFLVQSKDLDFVRYAIGLRRKQ